MSFGWPPPLVAKTDFLKQNTPSPGLSDLLQSAPMASSFKDSIILNAEQERAKDLLASGDNIFLTGAAGTGKSHLIRLFLEGKSNDEFPILASTAAAAILVGGRTFHSFFGIGILEGGYQATLERALRNRKLTKRLKKAKTVIIDEVSMLSGTHLRLAEEVARMSLKTDLPWGGLRIIAVGDFAQLPPVNVFGPDREWAFLNSVWEKSGFIPVLLTEVMRTQDSHYLSVLGDVREGRVTPRVRDFLNSRLSDPNTAFEGTRLFAKRDLVEKHNLTRLADIDSPVFEFVTEFTGSEKDVERFKKNVPIPELLKIKKGALVMFRQNDLEGRWVNGSLGTVTKITPSEITVLLLNEREVKTERADFTMLDADGTPVAKANNFPLQLAWALTIHKAQGTTLDRMRVDIRGLWEPGQAYVALSRVKNPQELYIDSWNEKSIFMDPQVRRFYQPGTTKES